MVRAAGGGDVTDCAVLQDLGNQRDLAAGTEKRPPGFTEEGITMRVVMLEVAFVERHDVRRSRGAGFHVDIPETAQTDPAARVLRVETGTVSAIVRHAELLVDNLSFVQIPGEDTFRVPALFRDPELPVRSERQSAGVYHSAWVVAALIGAARCPDGRDADALRVETMYLVGVSVAHNQVAVGCDGDSGKIHLARRDQELAVAKPDHALVSGGKEGIAGGQVTYAFERNGIKPIARLRVENKDGFLIA